jgi:tripartite-type tricarboxylate transporter receptor subunit TctC
MSIKFIFRKVCFLFLAFASISAIQTVQAQYPDRPITYIHSAGAGSGPDALIRLLFAEVGKKMGTTFVVENRSGGGGLIASQALANAKPDGYTIGHGNTQTLAINPNLSEVSMREANRIQTIVQIGYTPNLLSVNPKLPIKSVSELIAYAKKNSGKLFFGSPGVGTTAHVGMELFNQMAGTKMEHVPYKSAPAVVADVVAGHIDVAFDNLAGSLTYAKDGKIRALAVTSPTRSSLLPDVPTVSEAGLPGYQVVAWSGIIAPKGVPSEVVEKLNTAINQTLKEPSIVKGIHQLGYEIVGGTPQEFASKVAKERNQWAQVIHESGATSK